MNSREPKWHLDKNSTKAASAILTLSRATLVMTGDLAVGLYKSFYPHPYYHTFCKHKKSSFESTLSRLKKEGYLEITKRNNEKIFVLTEKGRRRRDEALSRVEQARIRTETWDGRWRLVIFDIPESKKRYRDFLRGELYEYGFIQFQKSVWVTPYRIDDYVRTMINDHGLARFVRFAVVEKWDNESELRRLFKLS